MNALGSLSQIYMFLLLALLFLGFGLAIWGFINYLLSRKTGATGPINKGQSKVNRPAAILDRAQNNNKKMNGGYFMNNNGWIKLAVFSFVGIIISVIILGFISTSGNQGLTSQHNQMQNSTTGTMQMQNGAGTTNDQMMMQQQLNQMQQLMSQMQQQMGMTQNNAGTNMSSGTSQGSMNQSGGSGMMMDSMMTMMGGMMDMMGNMQQQNGGSMSNMPAAAPAAAPAMAPMPMM